MRAGRIVLLAGVLALGAPATAGAQVFFATRPDPPFAIGPLFVRARVTPALGDTQIDVLFSVAVPPRTTVAALEQDLYLVWPGAVAGDPALGAPDPALARDLEQQGLAAIDEGRVPIVVRNLYRRGPDGRTIREAVPGGAPYVTFVREGGALGLSAPATWIRIPWSPRLVNREWLVTVRLAARGLVKPKAATWFERTFWGQRHRLTLSFGDVRQRAIFPLYFRNRDRVIRLSDDPSQIIVNFTNADMLKIDELFPQSVRRQRSETMESTEQVSLYLDPGEGLRPQTLAVQFGYFSGLQSWAPILVPTLFFVLGNIAAVVVRNLAGHLGRRLSSRVAVGKPAPVPSARESGVVIPREIIARIVPGQTGYEDVRRLVPAEPEEHEHLGTPDRRTLIYRGRRVVPQRKRSFGWVSTVARWDVEDHEVEIAVERGVVLDVQARLRRSHPPSPDGT